MPVASLISWGYPCTACGKHQCHDAPGGQSRVACDGRTPIGDPSMITLFIIFTWMVSAVWVLFDGIHVIQDCKDHDGPIVAVGVILAIIFLAPLLAIGIFCVMVRERSKK